MASPPHDMPMNDESKHVSHSLGKDDFNHEYEDFEFFDMNKLQFLVTYIATLEEQVKNMNAYLSKVMTLLKELVPKHCPL